ncbi:hypothetical protein DFJ74DRAFT_754746 [Hyaloraphidium curvatum]|nr:hypothetical protein DFJ74DRAFT_754746 [Hyaloraphidium curvatum]
MELSSANGQTTVAMQPGGVAGAPRALDFDAKAPAQRLDLKADGHPDPHYMSGAKHVQTQLLRGPNTKPTDTWREWLAHVFESQRFHLAVICLTMVDLLFIVTELIIEVLASHSACQLEYEEGEPHAHIEYSPGVETALNVLFWASISILVTFCIELCLKLVVFGPMHFIKHPFELFDFIVVVVSLTLDLVFHSREDGVAIEVLIVLRLWRLVRVFDGVAGEVKENGELQAHRFERTIEKLEAELKLKEAEIEELKSGRKSHISAENGNAETAGTGGTNGKS